MITLDFGGGLLLGLASSLHCAGMCGGIAASIALAAAPGASAGGRLVALLQAQAGKAAGYMAAGAALGWAGAGLYGALDLAEAFGILQKVSAAVLIWTALGLMGLVPSPAILGRLFQPLSRWMLRARRSARGLAAAAAGLAWGLIPCGMVYAALLYALLAGTPGRGALVMAGFALGVLPSVTATALGASSLVRAGARPALRLAAGGALIAFALATLVWPAGAAPGLCLPPAGLHDTRAPLTPSPGFARSSPWGEQLALKFLPIRGRWTAKAGRRGSGEAGIDPLTRLRRELPLMGSNWTCVPCRQSPNLRITPD